MEVLLHFPFMAMILSHLQSLHGRWPATTMCSCQYEELSNSGQMFNPPPILVWAAIVSPGGGTSDILVIPRHFGHSNPVIVPTCPERLTGHTVHASTLLLFGRSNDQPTVTCQQLQFLDAKHL